MGGEAVTDFKQGQGVPNDYESRYVNIAGGDVYALLRAAEITYQGAVLTAANALPVSMVGTTPTNLTMTHSAVNVNGDTAVIAANTNRKYVLIVNDSDTVIYLNLTGAGVVNQGIRLNANGGSYELTGDTGMHTGAIRANHGGGAVNKRLLITEGV